MKKENYYKLDESIILKLHQKDEEAFAIVYKAYERKVYNIAYHCFKNTHTAEDIVQNTFLIIYQYLDRISSVQALTIWVNKIAYQRCMKELRNKQVMVIPEDENWIELIEDTHINNDIIDVLNRKELYELIEQALFKMDDKLKVVGILRYYEELTTKEIAEIMDIPEGTVKSRLHQIKKSLRIQFKDYGLAPMHSFALTLSGIAISVKSTPRIFSTYIAEIKAVLHTTMITGFVAVAATACAMYLRNENITPYYKITYETELTNESIQIHVDTSYQYEKMLINNRPETTITENGIYEIVLLVEQKKVYLETIHINNIDKKPPVFVRQERDGDNVKLFLSEKESGIQRKNIKYFLNEEESYAFSFDEDMQIIVFQAKVYQKQVFEVRDMANNAIEIRIETNEI